MYYCKDRDFINWLLGIKLNNERTISKANIRCLANKEQKKRLQHDFCSLFAYKRKKLNNNLFHQPFQPSR